MNRSSEEPRQRHQDQAVWVTLDEFAAFLTTQKLAVVSTLGPDGGPQAALVGIAVSDDMKLIFDSIDISRKVRNLRRDPRVAVVIGGTMEDERTVQIDGMADEPNGDEGRRIREEYFTAWPDGRERQRWSGITHLRVMPSWIRLSDWNATPPVSAEWTRNERGVLEPIA